MTSQSMRGGCVYVDLHGEEYPVEEDGATVVPDCIELGVELEHLGCEIEGILGPVFSLFLAETMSPACAIQGCTHSR